MQCRLNQDALMHFLKEEHLTGDERWRHDQLGIQHFGGARRPSELSTGVQNARKEWIQSRR